MPVYVLSCIDKANSLPLRMATREAHIAYVGGHKDKTRIVGPLFSPAGEMAGSLLILEAPDLAAAEAFNAEDPYTKAGLWDHVDIHEFRAPLGQP